MTTALAARELFRFEPRVGEYFRVVNRWQIVDMYAPGIDEYVVVAILGNPRRKEVIALKPNVPDYMQNLVTNTTNAFCDTLHNPSLWSETLIRRTLERTGSQAFNITDVQMIVKDYLSVLSEVIRKGEAI